MSDTFPRPQDERRRRLFCYQGNRQVIEKALGDDVFPRLCHPNRVMQQFRSSNRPPRRVA